MPVCRRAQLYFAEEGDERGQWWAGTVVDDAQAHASGADGAAEGAAPADRWACGGLWERYQVAWDAQACAHNYDSPLLKPERHESALGSLDARACLRKTHLHPCLDWGFNLLALL